jgi:Ca2+/Na+ antiporter
MDAVHGMRFVSMNPTLLKAIVASTVIFVLFLWSASLFVKQGDRWSFFQMIGAGSFVLVILTHFCEALDLFPVMRWGVSDSVGHYLDLSSAILGVTLFPIGLLGGLLANRGPK